MKKTRLILASMLAAFALTLSLNTQAQAQCGDRIQTEIEHTRLGLTRAKEKVIPFAVPPLLCLGHSMADNQKNLWPLNPFSAGNASTSSMWSCS